MDPSLSETEDAARGRRAWLEMRPLAPPTSASSPATTPPLPTTPLPILSGPRRLSVGRAAAAAGTGARVSPADQVAEAAATPPPPPPAPSTSSPRVVYGPGTVARLPAELGRLRLSSPLIVSSPSRIALARRIQALIPSLDSRILDSAIVNVPGRVVDTALDRISGRDVVISVGGASAVGLAKAVGRRKRIPHICIPTTYSGSEAMPLLLDTSPARHAAAASPNSRRQGPEPSRRWTAGYTSTVRHHSILPTVVIYDEELTVSAPRRFSAPSDTAECHACPSSKDNDTAQWSYIHLPGV